MAAVSSMNDTFGTDRRHVAIKAKVADFFLWMLLAEVSLLPIGCIVPASEGGTIGNCIVVRHHLLWTLLA